MVTGVQTCALPISVTYDPAMIKTAIQDMVDALNGTTFESEHVIPVHVVDASNVNEFQGF